MDRKLPIGIQSFEKLRDRNNLYVDKTGYIYKMVHTDMPYFLSRPRRFGKSLLLSALKAYWEGKKDLFKGLEIERLEEGNPDAWLEYPVFYFDFNGANYNRTDAIENVLEGHLREWESIYETGCQNRPLEERFQKLIDAAVRKTGRRCVILVDEYDKPLLETMGNKELVEHNKAVFKGFFSVLKSSDDKIGFVFITGVTKFSKISIFSDVNQLRDISMVKEYSEICGITDDELKDNFLPEIEELAKEQGLSGEECLLRLKSTYDGYLFHEKGKGVYNPYSLLTAFENKEFGSYWFETGTPDFLVKRLRDINFEARKFTDGTLYADKLTLLDYRDDDPDPVPLLYQTGYLTITDYDRRKNRYTLGFPNDEVRYGFLDSLMPLYVPKSASGSGLDIYTLDEYIEKGQLDDIRRVLTALFAGITYTSGTDPFEHYFQAVIYIVFTLLGKYVLCEMHTFTGRIDCKIETDKFIYLFEFKRDDTAEAALSQIDSRDYALPFVADRRKLFKIGVSFDSKKRKLSDWKAVER